MNLCTQKLQSIFKTLDIDLIYQQKLSEFLDKTSKNELLYPISISAKTGIPIQIVLNIFALLSLENIIEVYTVPKYHDQYYSDLATKGYKLPKDLEIQDELDFSIIPREDIEEVAAFKLVSNELA